MESSTLQQLDMEASYNNTTEVAHGPTVKLDLQPCPVCGRTFVPATLVKHAKICEKMATKKRKVFDSSKQRWEGTDLAEFRPKSRANAKQEPKTSPKPIQNAPIVSPKRLEDVPKPPPIIPKKVVSPVPEPPPQKEKPKLAPKRALSVPTKQCPHCERGFCVKSYERHVEWCKEKARINSMQNNSSLLAAKERLQARTKYRAPCLKTKRAANREKYSGLNCEGSTNSLSDGGDGTIKKPHVEERKASMSTSLSSSIMSDGGLSDKYDPFLSAKRQLEELCSPNSPASPVFSPTTPNLTSKAKSSLSPSYSSTNPRTALNTVKSNFRRTSSLRAPRKTSSRPIFVPPSQQRPTIQRGISDEGPISSNFLKPEEYDEMPVKSVCVNDFAISKSPKVVKRDGSANMNRKNLRLNLNKSNDKANNSIPLSKTDSLAIFLKYENEAKHLTNPIDLTEKDLKDKSNNLSKQTSQKNPVSTVAPSKGDKESLPNLKESLANIIETKNSSTENSTILDPGVTPLNSNRYPIKLEPLPKSLSSKSLPFSSSNPTPTTNVNLASILDSKDSDFIDPKLINVCDNLPVNVSKLSDSDLTSSSSDSNCTAMHIAGSQTQIQRQSQYHQFHSTSSNRSSTEKRNLLKRQMRLGKNQFLYDMSPDSDPYSEECDKTISIIDPDLKQMDLSTNEPTFDDFDFEEFLSSFENDEDQFPIFRDCKEFLLNRSFNKRCTNLNEHSIRSPSALNIEFENDENKNQIFISIESNQSGSTPSPVDPPPNSDREDLERNNNKIENTDTKTSSEKRSSYEDVPDVNKNNVKNIMKKIENEISEKDEKLVKTRESGITSYPADSDEISSGDCYSMIRSTKSKQSADSAYGSLSRHSPTEQKPMYRSIFRSRQQSSVPSIRSPILLTKSQTDSKQRTRNLSISSSGSDTSLPPIQLQKDKEKTYEEIKKEKDPLLKKEVRMSKFCHECGSKFVVTQAKFCMECGVKRIVLE